MGKKLVLIDGHSILNRAFYGVPDLTNSDGMHTNAIYGFLNILFKILEEEQADYLTVAFDLKAPTFRHKMYKEYKGTRKPMPEELHQQVPIMKELLNAMGIKTVEKEGYEADDLLGTLAKKAEQEGISVSLVSGDRDLLQLASDKIKIRIPKTKRGKTEIEDYNTNDVIEKYHVTPLQIIDLKGLMGDTSDNIPGVPGIGEKRATAIIESFGSVEEAYMHIEEVKPPKARESLREHYDMAVMSKKLATIDTNAPIEFSFEEAKIEDFYTKEAFELIKRLEFKSILSKFGKDMSHNDNLEQAFSYIKTKKEAERLFSELEEMGKAPEFGKDMAVGIQILQREKDNNSKFSIGKDGQYSLFADKSEASSILGIGLAFGEKVFSVLANEEIKEDFLMKQIEKMAKAGFSYSTFQLKEQLNIFPVTEESKVYDLSVAAYLLNPLKDSYLYDDIARDYLMMTVPSYQELFGKRKIEEAFESKKEEVFNYLCYEAYVALKAKHVLFEKLEEENMKELYEEIEMPLVFTLYDMEARGIMVNKEELKEYGEQLEVKIHELEKNIYDLAGEVFNINSPKQLGVILFEKLKLPFAKKTKTGYSTSADILEKLKCEDPIVSMILEYRQLTKLKSTYADGLAAFISESDQRIHGKFNQTITATGRISSTEPNLQNIPIRMELGRQIRKVFIPKEDYVFLDADYSQIELRVLAHMSGDKTLIKAYKEEQDIHKITASQVFHTPLNEVTGIQRSNAKAVNFGIVYGISSFGLGQDLNITRKEAEEYIKKYFETYPRVKEFLDELVEKGKKDGYVESLFHRRRPIPELKSANYMQRSFGERIAMNSPIQGTAADIIKIAMIRVNRELKQRNMKSSLLLQVHDELLIETHKEEIDEVKEILQKEMFHAVHLEVPMEIDINEGKNWYEAK
ncbi:DNA polymerase I [Velocimicrobium porci]|uniref:DNA polymerase I n=1 Tax=Velocimicrobium porci TaxID=2606634 RepID=A0A6L5XY35_9FIRM|nr:DNA polymerase I [Velocimicrobium porci]MSS63371.1 DNA polymerase I [Velocimicrobium porci]